MGSRQAHLSRGRSLSRLLLGITLPQPTVGAKLLLNTVAAPEGPFDNVLTGSSSTYLPNSVGFGNGTTGNKLFWEMTNPYGPLDDGSLTFNVYVDFLDESGNGVRFVYREGNRAAPADKWFITSVSAYTASTAYVNFSTGADYGDPLASRFAAANTLQLVYLPGTSPKVNFYADRALIFSYAGISTAGVANNLSRVRYTAPSGFGRTAIKGVKYGIVATPMILRSATPTTTLGVEAQVDYTNLGDQADVPNIQLYYADGVTPYGAKHQAVLVSNTKGSMTLRSAVNYTSAQNGTQPQFKLYEVVNGIETGFVIPGTIVMPARVATFGANLVAPSRYGPLRTYADLWRVGVSKDTSNNYATLGPNVAGKTDAGGWPLSSVVERQVGPPDTSGQTIVITWDGTGNTIKSVAPSEGDTVISGQQVISANSFSYVQNFTRSGIGGNSFAAIKFNIGSVPPTNIKMYVQGEDRTKYWSDSYLAYANKSNIFSGAMRVMDGRNINGNGTIAMTWAMRTLPDDANGGYDGECIERLIELANASGRDLWCPIPAYATDDYVTQLAIAIDRGTNLSQGKPWSNGLAPGLKWYWERGNEVWNVQFANFSYDRTMFCNRTGATRLGDSNGGVEQAFKEHAFQYARMANLVMAAIPNYADRVVRVMATLIGGSMYTTVLQEIGPSLIDAYANAPYFQVQAYATQINELSSKTPENIEPFMIQAIDNVLDALAVQAARAKTNGHRFICYEAGMDWAAHNDPSPTGKNNPVSPSFDPNHPMYLTGQEIFNFRTSPSMYRATYRYMNGWKSRFGDELNQYYDIGGTPGGQYQWGLKPYQGAPGPDYGVLALQDVIAGTAPRY